MTLSCLKIAPIAQGVDGPARISSGRMSGLAGAGLSPNLERLTSERGE